MSRGWKSFEAIDRKVLNFLEEIIGGIWMLMLLLGKSQVETRKMLWETGRKAILVKIFSFFCLSGPLLNLAIMQLHITPNKALVHQIHLSVSFLEGLNWKKMWYWECFEKSEAWELASSVTAWPGRLILSGICRWGKQTVCDTRLTHSHWLFHQYGLGKTS